MLGQYSSTSLQMLNTGTNVSHQELAGGKKDAGNEDDIGLQIPRRLSKICYGFTVVSDKHWVLRGRLGAMFHPFIQGVERQDNLANDVA